MDFPGVFYILSMAGNDIDQEEAATYTRMVSQALTIAEGKASLIASIRKLQENDPWIQDRAREKKDQLVDAVQALMLCYKNVRRKIRHLHCRS